MMLWIVGILCALMVLGFVIGVKSKTHDDYESAYFLLSLSVVPLVIIGVLHIPVYLIHCDELAIIRNSQSMIAVHTQAIEDLDRQMSNLTKSIDNKTLFNTDSPYRSLIETKSHYVSNLSEARVAVVRVKTSIMARKLGLMSHIVRWVGEE